MVQESICIAATDGYPLAARVFSATGAGEPKGVVVIAGATGVRMQRYAAFAQYLARSGWQAITFDYRGIGGSLHGTVRDLKARMYDWGSKDLAGVIAFAEQRVGSRRLVVVGHSVGGQIVAFAPNHRAVSAVLTVGAQNGYWRFWDGWRRYVICFLWHVLPLLVKLSGRLPLQRFGRGEDLPPGIALEWGRWGRTLEFVDPQGNSLREEFRGVRAPILALSFADDRFLAPRRAVESLHSMYSGAKVLLRHLRPTDLDVPAVGHSGFFVPGLCPLLWHETELWLRHAGGDREDPRSAT